MTGLEDVFGESFAEQFQEEREQRINSRNQVDDQTMAGIAYKILEEDALDPTEPQFTYTDDNSVTHDVLLMTVPDPDDKPVWTYMNELKTGAVSLPLDYMGEWMSVLFNDKDMVGDISQGDEVIIVGNLDQWMPDGSDEPEDQVSPARGVMLLDELPEHAQNYEQGEMEQINETSTTEETTEDTTTDESEDSGGSPFSSGSSDDTEDEEDGDDSSSSSSFSGFDSDDEEEDDDGYDIDEESVRETVDTLAEKKEEVLELEEGDDRLQDVAMFYIDNHMNPEKYDRPELKEIVAEISDIVVEYLEEKREDEEEDEEEGSIFDNSDSIFG